MSLNQRPGGYLLKTGIKPGATVQAQELINGLEVDDLYKRDGASLGITLHHDLFTDRWLGFESNTFLGYQVAGAGNLADPGQHNDVTGIGHQALYSITEGELLTAVGAYALKDATGATFTTAVGAYAGGNGANGSHSTYVGAYAGYKNDGDDVTAVGREALNENVTGTQNTAIGSRAGASTLSNLSGCVYIGYGAGTGNAVSNTLWIHNAAAATPLVYGRFDQMRVGINQSNPQHTLDVGGAGKFSTGVYADSVYPISTHVDLMVNGGFLRVKDSGNSDNIVASLGDAAGYGGFLQLENDAGSPTAVIQSYAISNVQAYFTAGSVVIGGGSTLDANTKLNITGTGPILSRIHASATDSYAGLMFSNDVGSVSWYYGGDGYTNLPNTLGLYMNNGVINRYAFVVDENGRIATGGHKTPAYDLVLYTPSSDQSYLAFQNTTTGTGSGDGFVIGINSGEQGIIYHTEAKPIRFGINNTYRLGIGSSGNLGIGIEADLAAELVHIYQSDNSVLALGDTPNLGANIGYIKFQRNSPNGQQVGSIIVHDNTNAEHEAIRFGAVGRVGIGNVRNPMDFLFEINGEFAFTERSSDPANPDEGWVVIWMSNGTGSGDDGDILCKITAGGVTKTGTLIDFSAL